MELSELKEQNAAEEADKLALETAEPTEEFKTVEEAEDAELETVEPWMQEEEAGEQTPDDPSKNVPVGKFVSLKKELRGQIADRDEELEKLRSENEALRLASPKQETTLNRPNRDDHGTDEEYEVALSKYEGDRLQDTYNRNRKVEQQDEATKQAQENINQAMDSHYERADKLMETSGLSKEKYIAASKNTKAVFDEVFGQAGNMVFENVFAKLGKGSEKLEYFIGVNRAAQDKVKSLINDDPLGISLAMWLGEEKQRLTKLIKPKSNAPDPAQKAGGDVPTGGNADETKMRKAYQKIGPGTTESYNIKKKGKAAGYDVSGW